MNKDGGRSCSAWTADTAFLATANGHADDSNCRGIRGLPETWWLCHPALLPGPPLLGWSGLKSVGSYFWVPYSQAPCLLSHRCLKAFLVLCRELWVRSMWLTLLQTGPMTKCGHTPMFSERVEICPRASQHAQVCGRFGYESVLIGTWIGSILVGFPWRAAEGALIAHSFLSAAFEMGPFSLFSAELSSNKEGSSRSLFWREL